MENISRRRFLKALTVAGLSGCDRRPNVCVAAELLTEYHDSLGRYALRYPLSWSRDYVVDSRRFHDPAKPLVAFQNLLSPVENVSVMASTRVTQGSELRQFGGPNAFAQHIAAQLRRAGTGPNRLPVQIRVLQTHEKQDAAGRTYYIITYEVSAPQWRRVNVSSVTIADCQVWTLNAQAPADSYDSISATLDTIADSFTVYSSDHSLCL